MIIENESLRDKVSGDVLTPADDGYDAARAVWNLFIDQRPDLVVVAESEEDVIAAVRYADRIKVPITVQATGHGQPKTCAGGILINTAKLKSVAIDAAGRKARVGGGVRWRDVIEAAYLHGLAPVSGSSPSVGVVGYTIGGGYGITSRMHGLTIDNVREVRIVIPNGDLKVASARENSDLFHAVLGAGGSFGVVTEMTIDLHDHAEVFGGSVMFDASRAPAVYRAYAEWTPDLPDAVSSALHLMTFPPAPFVPEFLHGRSMAVVIGSVCASLERAEGWLSPMRSLDGAELDSFRRMPFTESGTIFQDPIDPLPINGRGVLLNDFTGETARIFLDAIGPIPQSPNIMIQLRHLGGTISRNGRSHACILRNRQAKYFTYFLGIPSPETPPEVIAAHAEKVFGAIKPWVMTRGPLNWLGEGFVDAAHIRSVFSDEEFARIWKIKQALDPGNRFSNAGLGIC
ncbi:MAG: FAD-binding oxidoreductase [Desulfobacterales bacterium]